jgi:hypothetical protein
LLFPKDYTQRNATYVFIEALKEWNIKQHLFRSINKSLNQDLNLGAADLSRWTR